MSRIPIFDSEVNPSGNQINLPDFQPPRQNPLAPALNRFTGAAGRLQQLSKQVRQKREQSRLARFLTQKSAEILEIDDQAVQASRAVDPSQAEETYNSHPGWEALLKSVASLPEDNPFKQGLMERLVMRQALGRIRVNGLADARAGSQAEQGLLRLQERLISRIASGDLAAETALSDYNVEVQLHVGPHFTQKQADGLFRSFRQELLLEESARLLRTNPSAVEEFTDSAIARVGLHPNTRAELRRRAKVLMREADTQFFNEERATAFNETNLLYSGDGYNKDADKDILHAWGLHLSGLEGNRSKASQDDIILQLAKPLLETAALAGDTKRLEDIAEALPEGAAANKVLLIARKTLARTQGAELSKLQTDSEMKFAIRNKFLVEDNQKNQDWINSDYATEFNKLFLKDAEGNPTVPDPSIRNPDGTEMRTMDIIKNMADRSGPSGLVPNQLRLPWDSVMSDPDGAGTLATVDEALQGMTYYQDNYKNAYKQFSVEARTTHRELQKVHVPNEDGRSVRDDAIRIKKRLNDDSAVRFIEQNRKTLLIQGRGFFVDRIKKELDFDVRAAGTIDRLLGSTTGGISQPDILAINDRVGFQVWTMFDDLYIANMADGMTASLAEAKAFTQMEDAGLGVTTLFGGGEGRLELYAPEVLHGLHPDEAKYNAASVIAIDEFDKNIIWPLAKEKDGEAGILPDLSPKRRVRMQRGPRSDGRSRLEIERPIHEFFDENGNSEGRAINERLADEMIKWLTDRVIFHPFTDDRFSKTVIMDKNIRPLYQMFYIDTQGVEHMVTRNGPQGVEQFLLSFERSQGTIGRHGAAELAREKRQAAHDALDRQRDLFITEEEQRQDREFQDLIRNEARGDR